LDIKILDIKGLTNCGLTDFRKCNADSIVATALWNSNANPANGPHSSVEDMESVDSNFAAGRKKILLPSFS